MIRVIIKDREGKNRVIPFIHDTLTLGRKEDNLIRLPDRNISRHHAVLKMEDGSVYVEDLDSYNGTSVNGTRIGRRTRLTLSDQVEIGEFVITLEGLRADEVPDDSEQEGVDIGVAAKEGFYGKSPDESTVSSHGKPLPRPNSEEALATSRDILATITSEQAQVESTISTKTMVIAVVTLVAIVGVAWFYLYMVD